MAPTSTLLPVHNQYQKVQPFSQQQLQQSNTFNPNRPSLPNANILRVQQQAQYEQQPPHHQQKQYSEKPAPGSTLGRGGPRLSLDTSEERLQNITVITHDNKKYLKLFSPSLVESPVSFLDQKQLTDDKKLWENGPNEAFQKQLEIEKREAYRARSKQQLRGFFMGLWLGCLLGFLILQQTTAKVYFGRHDSWSSYTPLVVLLVLMTSAIVARSGTRCTIAAVATCAAVLTCFATLIVNQSRYSPEFRVYKTMPPTTL
ncbi:hypothetical protein BG011_001377 [Mortierella polycephala]|uniref:Transmembrane protein n=1 Tax=Mortierella polycephala TaxID=41804 RepID=A0A9P6U609_9FUNG|nr:hypothetical protein BG011_001377 [Mortierella polycephala]